MTPFCLRLPLQFDVNVTSSNFNLCLYLCNFVIKTDQTQGQYPHHVVSTYHIQIHQNAMTVI